MSSKRKRYGKRKKEGKKKGKKRKKKGKKKERKKERKEKKEKNEREKEPFDYSAVLMDRHKELVFSSFFRVAMSTTDVLF